MQTGKATLISRPFRYLCVRCMIFALKFCSISLDWSSSQTEKIHSTGTCCIILTFILNFGEVWKRKMQINLKWSCTYLYDWYTFELLMNACLVLFSLIYDARYISYWNASAAVRAFILFNTCCVRNSVVKKIKWKN